MALTSQLHMQYGMGRTTLNVSPNLMVSLLSALCVCACAYEIKPNKNKMEMEMCMEKKSLLGSGGKLKATNMITIHWNNNCHCFFFLSIPSLSCFSLTHAHLFCRFFARLTFFFSFCVACSQMICTFFYFCSTFLWAQ